MSNHLKIFLSNRLEVLYQQLKSSLFGSNATPFMRRIVVVYGPAMKSWIMLRMAQDPTMTIAFGIEFVYLNQSFEYLSKLTSSSDESHIPSQIELSFAIENELTNVLKNFQSLDSNAQRDWEPVMHYLKYTSFQHHRLFSRKIERRITGLSQYVARLFQEYGKFAQKMVSQWQKTDSGGWQGRIWNKIFNPSKEWSYLANILEKPSVASSPFSLHLFSISFLSSSEFSFLHRLAENTNVFYYLLSPCAVFWSDIRSDRETAYIQARWQQKLDPLSSSLIQLEEYLRDRNPLLANFGRLGREMVCQIEESLAITKALYVLPSHVEEVHEDASLHEDLLFTETSDPVTLLHALQADLLLMRNPQESPVYDLQSESNSLTLHIAANPRREIEILYHNLLGIIAKDPSICPSDIIVMAPQISDYVPYIESIFGNQHSQLDFQILDLGLQSQNDIARGFLQLLELSTSRWTAADILQLFEHPSFQRRHQLTVSDYGIIRKWMEQAGIRWGDDWLHRNKVLQWNHCAHGMVEETPIGTWDYGIHRLLTGFTTVIDESMSHELAIPPCSTLDFSQADLIGKWIRILHSLRDDLSPLQDRTKMSIENWVRFLICLLENYFQPDFEDSRSTQEFDDLKDQLGILQSSSRFFKESLFPFTSIQLNVLSLLKNCGITYREDRFESVRFCSLLPLRSIPARVIAIVGLQDDAFPRLNPYSSLNLQHECKNGIYCPSSTDYDRYLFLEALHSAQDYLLLSYQGYASKDGKEIRPSLVIEELFSYLNKYYTLRGEKISDSCIFAHPFDSFDSSYFEKDTKIYNFSPRDFHLASLQNKKIECPPHRFLEEFHFEHSTPETLSTDPLQIHLKHLSAAARNPIKFHLNQVLEIYLQTEEHRTLEIEENLIISALDKYQIKQKSLKQPLERIIHQAEKEGQLPFGLFKTVAIERIREEVGLLHKRLQKNSIEAGDLFSIEFCTTISIPTQINSTAWLFPAPVIIDENNRQISIIGKLPHVSFKGFVVMGKATLADVWKIWPQFLLYCYAGQQYPEKFAPTLIFTESAQTKTAFFACPKKYLLEFVKYYSLCRNHFSPLLPEWIPSILENDASGLTNKMKSVFDHSFGGYRDHYIQWILNKDHLPDTQNLINQWKSQAELLMGDIVQFWFPHS